MTHPIPPTPAAHFTVATAEVRRAGVAMAEAATEVGRLRPHLTLDEVLEAMPDSASARAATRLTAVWEDTFAGWARAGERHAGALRTAADDYDTADSGVAAALRASEEAG